MDSLDFDDDGELIRITRDNPHCAKHDDTCLSPQHRPIMTFATARRFDLSGRFHEFDPSNAVGNNYAS